MWKVVVIQRDQHLIFYIDNLFTKRICKINTLLNASKYTMILIMEYPIWGVRNKMVNNYWLFSVHWYTLKT